MENTYQVLIIGAGPAGASAALYLARFCHDVTLFDAHKKVQGRTVLAPDIHNLLSGIQPPTGPDFIKKINQQLELYPQITRLDEKVVTLSKNADIFTATTDTGEYYEAKYVVLAIGLRDTMPPIDGLDLYYEHAIYHCLTCNWYERRDKKIAVVGDSDRAIRTAFMLATLHKPPSLVVVPGNKEFHYSQSMLEQAKIKEIPVYQSPIAELVGDDGWLHYITLADGTKLEIEILFTKLGHTRLDGFLDNGNIIVDREPEEGFIKVNFRTFETSVKNLFAIGPCNEGPDQVMIASGQGATAAIEIHDRILAELGI